MALKIIKDSVHGYISLDDTFSSIIDSAEFQRLKNIEQGSFRVLYPAARHDRFIHSLGTYHLSTKFAKNFIENIKEDLEIVGLDEEKLGRIRNSFCYASLLHDVGHAPFSHTTEDFFKLKVIQIEDERVPVINIQLRDEVAKIVKEEELEQFDKDFLECSPSAHEIMSAIILLKKAPLFLKDNLEKFDLELAARMVIGCTYDYNTDDEVLDEDKIYLGIRNCFIRLLNSQTVDVDKLDYITRDTQMSGFANVPIDIERLVRSVTAINENGWLYPAFRKNALSVIDNVFRAKTEQGLWMVSHPVVLYDAELLKYCIKQLQNLIDANYIEEVFSVEALEKTGVEVANKRYCLLNDIDVGADLRRFYDEEPLFQELYERQGRRRPVWKSYYEYRHLFGENEESKDSEEVLLFFKALMDYMSSSEIFVLNEETFSYIVSSEDAGNDVKSAATFLKTFYEKQGIRFDIVLLNSTSSFSPKFNPKSVYILFNNLPPREGKNYTTYSFLKKSNESEDKRRMFYLYSKDKLSIDQVEQFKSDLLKAIKAKRKKPRV